MTRSELAMRNRVGMLCHSYRNGDKETLRRLVAFPPSSGCGAFLKYAAGVYITPQNVVDFVQGKQPPNKDTIISNPPFSKEQI